MNLSIRSFDPELPFAELARPVSATEISVRASRETVESRAHRADVDGKGSLGMSRTRDAALILRRIKARSKALNSKAAEKFRKREERRRAK